MSDSREDLARLEQRVATLETLVRRLMAAEPVKKTTPEIPALPKVELHPARPTPLAAPRPLPPAAAAETVDWEQWFGARGLLLVGVIALLAAAGFFFKYAFDHGWIDPWLRVSGGVALGIGLGVFGEMQLTRGLRRYGLALIGGGGGLIFLAIWAAAGPYALIGPRAGTMIIALMTAGVAARAAHHDSEPLALWALLGAYSAPLLLPAPDARPETLLAYSALISYAGGALAHQAGWRKALLATLFGYFIVVPMVVPDALPTVPGLAYAALGGMMALRAVQDREWSEARVGGQLVAWLVLLVGAGDADGTARWAAVLFGVALLLASWHEHRHDEHLQDEDPRTLDARRLAFGFAPVGLALVAAIAHPGVLGPHPEIATALIAALYLLTGWRGRWAPWVAIGLAGVAAAIAQQWQGPTVVAEWSLLIVLAVLADKKLDQRGGVPVAMILAAIGFVLVMGGVAWSPAAVAMSGPWTRTLVIYVAALIVAAMEWRHRDGEGEWHRVGPTGLWILAGVSLFMGVSLLIQHFFAARVAESGGSALAGNLAISFYWLIYAAALVTIGFRIGNARVRSAGLAVAGLAAAKVALFDLSQLEALYRVASFFGLALIALAVAYAYNRRTRSEPVA